MIKNKLFAKPVYDKASEKWNIKFEKKGKLYLIGNHDDDSVIHKIEKWDTREEAINYIKKSENFCFKDEEIESFYKITAVGITDEKIFREMIDEVNNCEFCNNGLYFLEIVKLTIDKKGNQVSAIVKSIYSKYVKIQECLMEMKYCEFCHNDEIGISIVSMATTESI